MRTVRVSLNGTFRYESGRRDVVSARSEHRSDPFVRGGRLGLRDVIILQLLKTAGGQARARIYRILFVLISFLINARTVRKRPSEKPPPPPSPINRRPDGPVTFFGLETLGRIHFIVIIIIVITRAVQLSSRGFLRRGAAAAGRHVHGPRLKPAGAAPRNRNDNPRA